MYMVLKGVYCKLFVFVGLLIYFLRPGIPGQLLGGFYVLVTFILLFSIGLLKQIIVIPNSRFMPVWYLLFMGYLFINVCVSLSLDLFDFIKISLISFLPILWILFVSNRNLYVFLKSLLKLNVLLSLSAIITYSMMIFVNAQFQLYELKLDTFVDNDHYKFGVFFPFSILYSGAAIVGGQWFPRFIGLFREPGIAQFAFIMSYYTVNLFFSKKKLLFSKIVLLTGFILTFSTAGIIGFFLSEVIRLAVFKRGKGNWKYLKNIIYILGALCLILVFLYFIFDDSMQFGVAGKLANKSGASRVLSMITALDFLLIKPWFGHGFHKFSQSEMFENVNLLTASSEIGIVGVILYFTPFFVVGRKLWTLKSNFFLILINYFLLVLLSQPIYYLPISIMVLVILDYVADNNSFFSKILIIR